MKYSVIVAIHLCAVNVSCGFQVSSDKSGIYKKAIESALLKNVTRSPPVFEVFDDPTYTPEIPSEGQPAARPLIRTINSEASLPPSRDAVRRKTCGLDEHPAEYWFDNRIHTFGNTGILGGFHAVVAPLATKMIDVLAYDRVNVREKISSELRRRVNKKGSRVLDLCCGVGLSTRALSGAFHDAKDVIGVDTSPEMVSMARTISRCDTALGQVKTAVLERTRQLPLNLQNKIQMFLDARIAGDKGAQFAIGNAERTVFPDSSFDLVTLMYAFHEIPRVARYRILREVRRLLPHGGTLAVVDISSEYNPSPTMLAGEPYVLEYKKNIHKQMKSIQGFGTAHYKEIVPGHVGVWTLRRDTTNASKERQSLPLL